MLLSCYLLLLAVCGSVPFVGIREFESPGMIPPGMGLFLAICASQSSREGSRACLFLHLPHIFAVSWYCSVQEKHSVLFPSDALLLPKGNQSYVHLQPQFGFSFNAVFLMLHILSAQHILLQIMY